MKKTNSWQELSDFQRGILSLLICNSPQPELARILLLGELRKQKGDENYLSKIGDGEDTLQSRKVQTKKQQEINADWQDLYLQEWYFLQSCKLPFMFDDKRDMLFRELDHVFWVVPYEGEHSYGGNDLYLTVRVDERNMLLDFQNLATYPIPANIHIKFNFSFRNLFYEQLTIEKNLRLLEWGLSVFPNAFFNIQHHKDELDFSFLHPLNHLQKNIHLYTALDLEDKMFSGLQNICFCYNAKTPDFSFKSEQLEAFANSETWLENNLTIKYVR